MTNIHAEIILQEQRVDDKSPIMAEKEDRQIYKKYSNAKQSQDSGIHEIEFSTGTLTKSMNQFGRKKSPSRPKNLYLKINKRSTVGYNSRSPQRDDINDSQLKDGVQGIGTLNHMTPRRRQDGTNQDSNNLQS